MDSLVVDAPRARGAGYVLLGLTLVALAWLSDQSGRLLAAPAALVALALGGWDLCSGPVLRADAGGLQLRPALGRRRVPWVAVKRMRVVRDRRAELLELDLDGQLTVLSRSRLGRLPTDVLADLMAVRESVRG